MGRFLAFREVFGVSASCQMAVFGLVYFWIFCAGFYWNFTALEWRLYLAPLYEEVLFRGIVLGFLSTRYGRKTCVLLSSFLFGVWHLKNFGNFEVGEVLHQVLYAPFILGPVLALLVLRVKSFWPGVFVHLFSNAVLHPLSTLVLLPLLQAYIFRACPLKR